MAVSGIEWTDRVWNPVTGCDRVSPGCAHCYALTLAPRLRAMGNAKYIGARDGGPASGPAFGVTLHPSVLDQPNRWRKPSRVFVNSMSDLFHDEVPDEFIGQVFNTMVLTPRHTYQVLTKRPERMRDAVRRYYSPGGLGGYGDPSLRSSGYGVPSLGVHAAKNIWLGVSIENRRFVHRADVLRDTPAAVRFISAEPLLGPLVVQRPTQDCEHRRLGDGQRCIRPLGHPGDHAVTWGSTTADFGSWGDLDLADIDWLIVGGESGPDHRPIKTEWVKDLRDLAASHDTAFFFKQWGGRTPKAGGRELDGRTWNEFPTAVRA